MPTVYEDDDSLVVHGCGLRLLEDLEAPPEDMGSRIHVITDPPYEKQAHTKARRLSKGKSESYEIPFAQITEDERDRAARGMCSVSNGWILVFCQAEAVAAWKAVLERYGARWKGAAIWLKPDCAPQITGDKPAQGYESIACAYNGPGRSRWNGGGKRGVFVHNVNEYSRAERPHPTSKPYSLMRELVEMFTDAGDVIIDPFCGSGTTGRAAKTLGRSCILADINEDYCRVAADRLGGTMVARDERQPVLPFT